MGQRQSLVKCTLTDENGRIKYATSSMEGLCPCMEDARATILDLDGTGSTSFFGVYDGHGGANVALYCANQFHTKLLKDEQYQNNLDNAVEEVFFRMDEELREDDEWRELIKPDFPEFDLLCCLMDAACCGGVKGAPYSEGSTTCVALIRGNQIIVGNVGDSRCVLSRNGQATDLSTDHKPKVPEEVQRIQHAKRHLTRDVQPFRCSRSIGDFCLKDDPLLQAKQQIVICNPDVVTAVITDDTEFLLLASHGIWDILSSQGAVAFLHQKLESWMTDLSTICEGLLNHCLGSMDNLTMILVQFKPATRIPRSSGEASGGIFYPFFSSQRMDEQLREYDEWRELANPRRFRFNLLCCFKDPTGGVQGIPYTEGSTACVALIRGNQIIVGNVDDCRCVLSRNRQAMDLSTVHKPNLPDERRRIKNAGGRLTRDMQLFRCAEQTRVQWGSYRVNGLLSMSRSIGDFYLKSKGLPATEQMVTCNPDVRTADITDDTEFLLIASDVIWDILSSQGAVNFVHQKLERGTTDLRTICEALLTRCFRSRDNSTVILVQFKPAARIPLPHMFGEGDGEGAEACVLGAPLDIHLVQPRDGGAPPSLFQTIRQAGWTYWRKELKFAMKLGTCEDIPRSWSWESVMGWPAYGSHGCVMKAIATCTRALHCIAFERRYGAGSFRLQLSDIHMRYLIKACLDAGVCDSITKSAKVPAVVLLMRERGIWIRTQVVDGGYIYLLRFNRFGRLKLENSTSPPDSIAAYIRVEGPVIGTLFAGPDYLAGDDDDEYVYRGNAGNPNHAVVCMGYRYKDGELHIRILDNITTDGPLRWILFQVFQAFYYIGVEALDREALQQTQTTGLQYILQ